MPYFSIKMNTLLLVSVLITRPPNVRGVSYFSRFFRHTEESAAYTHCLRENRGV